jgi:hypothetical protein
MHTSASPQFHSDGTLPEAPGWILVFGSNLAGRHGAGAAKVARQQFGAIHGMGRGRVGESYAIPTKDADLKPLPIAEIETSITYFLEYARRYAETPFWVTRVGCGLAGFTDDQIGPLFAQASVNCSLPLEWRQFVTAQHSAPLVLGDEHAPT